MVPLPIRGSLTNGDQFLDVSAHQCLSTPPSAELIKILWLVRFAQFQTKVRTYQSERIELATVRERAWNRRLYPC